MSGFINFRKTVRCRVRLPLTGHLYYYNPEPLAISILQIPVVQSNRDAIRGNDASMLLPVRCYRTGSDLPSFAHPDDVQWHDASPVSKKHALETKDYRDTKRRPPALTPQYDLFKRANPEDWEDKRRSPPKTYDSRSFLSVEKPDDRHSSRGPRVLDERLRTKKDDTSMARVALPRSRPIDGDFDDTLARKLARNGLDCDLASVTAHPDRRMNAEAIVNIFHQLAK